MTDTEPTSYDIIPTRYALRVDPKMPEGMPLELMGAIWLAIGTAAERAGYRCYFHEDDGVGVAWFERADG